MDKATRVHSAERASGKRATFHVYYRWNGKLQFDPSWARTAAKASKDMIAFAAPMKIEVVEVVRCQPARV